MFAFQLCFRHAVIFGCNLFKNGNGFLAGRAAEYKVVVTEAYKIVLSLFTRPSFTASLPAIMAAAFK